MRSLIRTLTFTSLAIASATALEAQPRRPMRPPPAEQPALRERQIEMRERMLERREAMVERRGAGGRAGPQGRPGLRGPGGRPGLRGPAGGRAGMRSERAIRPMERRMIERRAVMRDRFESLKPEQQTALRQYREQVRGERLKVGEEIRAGKLDRAGARARMQKWRQEHKAPVDLRRRPPQD
jgi:hypothetical protein